MSTPGFPCRYPGCEGDRLSRAPFCAEHWALVHPDIRRSYTTAVDVLHDATRAAVAYAMTAAEDPGDRPGETEKETRS